MKLAKKIKKVIVLLLCTSMIMTSVLPSLAEENAASESAIEGVVENETNGTIEEVVEDETEGTESEDFSDEDVEEEQESDGDLVEEPEEEPEEDIAEEPEEDLSEEVEDIPEEAEEENVSSPSEIIDEEENDSIPADMVNEPEEDEVIDEPEEPMLLGSVASPSDTEEVEDEIENEIEGEVEENEATPSELGMPMLLGAPLFGDPLPTDACKIGSTGYATLGDALTAVTSGQTITMLQDVSYDGAAPNFIIDGKNVTIDFDGHSIKVTATSMIMDTDGKKLFTVTNSGNLILNDGEIILYGMYSSQITSFTVSGTNSVLTLKNIQQINNADHLLTNYGGKVYIDGGVFGSSSFITVKLVITNGGTLNIKNNASFKFSSTSLIDMGESNSSVASPDVDMGTVIIDSATFEQSSGDGYMIKLYGKSNVTINGGTFTGSGTNSSLILIENKGYKSSLTINNLTSDSPYVFESNNNPNIGSFTATVNNGHFKYTKGKFAIDRSNSLKPNIKLNSGFYGPDTVDDDALNELNGFCASGKTAEALSSSDAEYANGYRYKVYGNTPSPSPSSSGGGSSGGGGGGGSPKYDTLGNIIGPSGIQSYGYDGTNPPNLSGNITVSQWDYNTSNSHVADIHYVQNIDSFVRGNNTPVIAEWIGITTNTNSKVLWYRTNANGQILRNQFIQIGNNIYYFDNNGIMKTGQFTINGVTYNFETAVGATEGRFLY